MLEKDELVRKMYPTPTTEREHRIHQSVNFTAGVSKFVGDKSLLPFGRSPVSDAFGRDYGRST